MDELELELIEQIISARTEIIYNFLYRDITIEDTPLVMHSLSDLDLLGSDVKTRKLRDYISKLRKLDEVGLEELKTLQAMFENIIMLNFQLKYSDYSSVVYTGFDSRLIVSEVDKDKIH